MLQPIPPECSALKLNDSPTAWLWHSTKTHAFPQQVLHYALPAQRRKRHVPNSSNISNGAGASKPPTNPAHCTNHLLQTWPNQVCCGMRTGVNIANKTVSWPVHMCPKFCYSGDPRPAIYGIHWCPENCPLYPKSTQPHEPCPYATDKSMLPMLGEIRQPQTRTYLVPTLAAILGVCEGIHSNTYRAI